MRTCLAFFPPPCPAAGLVLGLASWGVVFARSMGRRVHANKNASKRHLRAYSLCESPDAALRHAGVSALAIAGYELLTNGAPGPHPALKALSLFVGPSANRPRSKIWC